MLFWSFLLLTFVQCVAGMILATTECGRVDWWIHSCKSHIQYTHTWIYVLYDCYNVNAAMPFDCILTMYGKHVVVCPFSHQLVSTILRKGIRGGSRLACNATEDRYDIVLGVHQRWESRCVPRLFWPWLWTHHRTPGMVRLPMTARDGRIPRGPVHGMFAEVGPGKCLQILWSLGPQFDSWHSMAYQWL